MTENINIFKLMIEDHNKLEKLLDKLEEDAEKSYEALTKTFWKFEWELEKHIFTEEKAIFTYYEPEDIVQGYKMLPQLTKQHNEILNKLEIMRRNIREKKEIDDIKK